MSDESSGVVLVRAWMQGSQVVARVRWTASLDGAQQESVVTGEDAVLDVVRTWMAALAGGAGT